MKKKNLIATSLAVVLAAVLLIGGTITYLTASTDPVENEFSTNHNDVKLDENTGGEYDIVPGTSQEKDPTITATYTLDSYVFVEVTDATDDMVTWDIAEGWKLLSKTENSDGSTTYVYYQLLKYAEEDAVDGICTTELAVLEGNKVYYPSTLTNEDMEDAEDISLTFQAYIIQATMSDEDDPYAAPATAYLIATGSALTYDANAAYVLVDADSESLAAAISDAAESDETTIIVLAAADDDDDSIELTSPISVTSGDVVIELNGNTLAVNSTNSLSVKNGAELTLVNGTVESTSGFGVSAVAASAEDGTSLTLTDVDVEAAATAVYAWGADVVIDGGSVTSTAYNAVDVEKCTVTISDSEITAAYIAVKANNSTISVTDSAIVSTDSSSTAIQMANTSSVTIDENSSVTAAGNCVTLFPAGSSDIATLNVYGTITATGSTFAIAGTGSTSYEGETEINIYEGAQITAEKTAIYHPQAGTLNVYGGTISGYAGIGISQGTLNIYGGTITGTANDTELSDSYSDSGLHSDGSGIILASAYGDVTVNISGGTIKSDYSYAIRGYKRTNYSYTSTVNITGGTLSGALGETNTPSYVYIPSDSSESFTVTDTRS